MVILHRKQEKAVSSANALESAARPRRVCSSECIAGSSEWAWGDTCLPWSLDRVGLFLLRSLASPSGGRAFTADSSCSFEWCLTAVALIGQRASHRNTTALSSAALDCCHQRCSACKCWACWPRTRPQSVLKYSVPESSDIVRAIISSRPVRQGSGIGHTAAGIVRTQ